MKKLTVSQQKIYDYLIECSSKGIPPTVREIGAAVGLKSTSSVQANLESLENMGLITRGDPMLKRSIRVSAMPQEVFNVPLLGTIAAGTPILATETVEEYLTYTGKISKDKPLFALWVKGDSMYDAGIRDGDIIIAEKTPVASNGDIVVALIEDEATVKTFYKEKGKFRLQPENEDYEPIIVDEVDILGKLIALYRYY